MTYKAKELKSIYNLPVRVFKSWVMYTEELKYKPNYEVKQYFILPHEIVAYL